VGTSPGRRLFTLTMPVLTAIGNEICPNVESTVVT
jgi:hypothetical protein